MAATIRFTEDEPVFRLTEKGIRSAREMIGRDPELIENLKNNRHHFD